MFKISCGAFALAASVCVMATLPARAAIQFEPGLWQDTETGTENGKPAKPEISTDCMTPEDAKDPMKAFSALKDTAGQQCKTLKVQQNGNTVSVNMVCGDPKQMSMDMKMTFTFIDSRHYTGTIKSEIVLAGRKMTADKKIESKWISAVCKKK